MPRTTFCSALSILADDTIFPLNSTVDAEKFCTLQRVLAGLEDYARVTGHYARRARHPALATEELKPACVSCWLTEKRIVVDSEGHGLLECEVGAQARRRFFMHCNIPADVLRYVSAYRAELEALVRLVALARTDMATLDGLARLATEGQGARARVFRALASQGSTVAEPQCTSFLFVTRTWLFFLHYPCQGLRTRFQR